MTGTNGSLVTGIVFSKDRALQLDATINSFFRHVLDPNSITLHVIYYASDDTHKMQYQQLQAHYPQVGFISESKFRDQTLELVRQKPFILFLVDDNIFVRPFSLGNACEALNRSESALGVSLRLGQNTNYCYSLNQPQRIPQHTRLQNELLIYDWRLEENDFNYALEVSSSLYRAELITLLLQASEFKNPNTLEAKLYELLPAVRDPFPQLIIYEKSVTFCNPINMVQTEYLTNRAGAHTEYSSSSLAELFAAGKRLDVSKYEGYTPKAAHEEVALHFTDTPLVSERL